LHNTDSGLVVGLPRAARQVGHVLEAARPLSLGGRPFTMGFSSLDSCGDSIVQAGVPCSCLAPSSDQVPVPGFRRIGTASSVRRKLLRSRRPRRPKRRLSRARRVRARRPRSVAVNKDSGKNHSIHSPRIEPGLTPKDEAVSRRGAGHAEEVGETPSRKRGSFNREPAASAYFTRVTRSPAGRD